MAGIDSVKFRGRHNSVKALVSLVIGSTAILTLIIMIIISGFNNAESTVTMGIIGVIAFFLCAAGLIGSVSGSKERDIFPAVPMAGIIVNGLGCVLYLVVYLLGAV